MDCMPMGRKRDAKNQPGRLGPELRTGCRATVGDGPTKEGQAGGSENWV